MKNFEFWKWIMMSLIATPFALLLGLWSGGAGHGDYVLAKILFPYTILSTGPYGSITNPFVALAVIQFPLYGVILGFAAEVRRPVAIMLGVVHFAAVILCFFMAGEAFSR